MSMEQLCHQTNMLVQDIQTSLTRLETITNPRSAYLAENEVQAMIDQMVSNCERMDTLASKESASRRANAKMTVKQLRYDCQHLQAALRQVHNKRYQREEEEKEREALLSQSFRANDSTSVLIDQHLDHHSRLSASNRRMDELISTGTGVLTNIKEQGITLKGTKRKMLDIANSLGLSNTVMRLIERRTTQDKVIFWVGVCASLLLMYFVWRYYGR